MEAEKNRNTYPKVSIVTVCKNCYETIEKTIKSVLAQNYPNLEYIIIDGCSTDGTKEIIERYSDRLAYFVSEPDVGIYDAMNKGVIAAGGDWIHFRNAGDFFFSENSVTEMFSNPVRENTVVLHGDSMYVNEWGRLRQKPAIIKQGYSVGMPVLHPSSFIRASFHKNHLYNSTFNSSGDYAFMRFCIDAKLEFEYRPIIVSVFPVNGYAMRNWRTTLREVCRIEGYNRKISWRYRYVRKYLKEMIKNIYFDFASRSKFAGAFRCRQLMAKGWKFKNLCTPFKPILGIINSDPMTVSYGGVAPIMKNMHPFLAEKFELRYFYLEDAVKKKLIPARLRMVVMLLRRRRELHGCDFIISHIPEGSWVVSLLGIPYAHIYHGNTSPMTISRYWYGRYFKWVFDLMFKRIEKTAAIKYTVGPVWGDKKKLFNPINHNVKPVPYSERKGLMFAGRLEKGKNIDRLIRIYSKLPETVRVENHFFIAGYGTQLEYLKSVVKETGIPAYVHFIGNLPNEDLIKTDSTKRILVMASSYEGLPTAIAEALSVGIPVISTNPGDIPLVLKDDYNGFIFPLEFNDEDYVNAILTILNDYDRFAEAALASAYIFDGKAITNQVIYDICKIL